MKAIIKTIDIKRLVKSTRHFMSKDETRPLLNFIRLDFDSERKTCKAVALDGFRLSEETSELKFIDESFSVYIKPYLPVGIKNETVTIELIGNRCFIDAGDSSVGYEQPHGKKFSTKPVLEGLQSNPVLSEIYVNGDFLIDALKSIQNKDTYEPIRIEYRGDKHAILLKTEKSVRLVMPSKH